MNDLPNQLQRLGDIPLADDSLDPERLTQQFTIRRRNRRQKLYLGAAAGVVTAAAIGSLGLSGEGDSPDTTAASTETEPTSSIRLGPGCVAPFVQLKAPVIAHYPGPPPEIPVKAAEALEWRLEQSPETPGLVEDVVITIADPSTRVSANAYDPGQGTVPREKQVTPPQRAKLGEPASLPGVRQRGRFPVVVNYEYGCEGESTVRGSVAVTVAYLVVN